MIRPGEEWGSPAESPPDLEVRGGDAALARAVVDAPGALIRFHPDETSDLARAVGLAPATGLGTRDTLATELPLDVLTLADGTFACNVCIFGTAPDRLRWWSPACEVEVRLDGRPWFAGKATTVVIAIGQFLRGLDLAPRGHPGDGKAEIQVYELRRSERRPMRALLATGGHVPHPRIRQRTARTIELRAEPAMAAEVDGVARPDVTSATSIKVLPEAYRLLL